MNRSGNMLTRSIHAQNIRAQNIHAYNIHARNTHTKPQGGFSLWELAVLLGLLGIALAAGITLLGANSAQQIEYGRTAQLTQADHALASFVAENGRLPCPDTTGSGFENCSSSAQKGWLPVITLGLNASAPARGVARLLYIVYRGAGADLTKLVDLYEPVQWDLTTTYSFNNQNVLDFCTGLTLAANAAPSNSSAYIPGASGATVNVAYGLAEGGIDKDGDGNLFDGNNISANPELDTPARATDASSYDDIVQVHSFTGLANVFKCTQATRGVDAISMAIEVANTVADAAANNQANGQQQIINAAVALAYNALSIANSVAVMIAGAVVLASAIAIAVASLGLDFAADAAIGVAAAGIALAIVAVAAYVVSGILNAVALAQSAIATAEANATPPSGMPSTVTPCDFACQKAALLTQVNAAQATYNAAQSTANTSATTAANQLTAYNNAVTNLKKGASTAQLNALNAALSSYKTYAAAVITYNTDQGNATSLQNQYNNTQNAITNATNQLATDQTALNADPTNATLQAKVANDQQVLANLSSSAVNNQLATQLTALNAANALAASDKTTMNNDLAAYNTAYNAVVAAYGGGLSGLFVGAQLTVVNNMWYNSGSSTNNYLSLQATATFDQNTANQDYTTWQNLLKTYNGLVNNPPPAGGLPPATYADPLDILKAADAKGALK